jgi:hypothetical protein
MFFLLIFTHIKVSWTNVKVNNSIMLGCRVDHPPYLVMRLKKE